MRRYYSSLAIVFMLIGCGTGDWARTPSTSETSTALTISGTFEISESASAALNLPAGSNPSLAKSLGAKAAALSESLVPNGTCELLDAAFTPLATGTTDANGAFTIAIPRTFWLLDTVNDTSGDTLTMHVRCTVTGDEANAVISVATISLDESDYVDSVAAGEDPDLSATVDTTSTTASLLLYRDTAINPLTATEDVNPPAIAHVDEVVESLDAALAAVNASDDTEVTGETVDASLRFLVEAVATLNTGRNLADGMTPMAALALLVDADDADSADLAALEQRLQSNDSLSDTEVEDVMAHAEAAGATTSALRTLAADTSFATASADTVRVAVGAVVIGKSADAVQQLVATNTVVSTVLTLADQVRTSGAGQNMAALAATMSGVFTPTLVLAATNNTQMHTVLQNVMEEAISSGTTSVTTIRTIGTSLETKAADTSYWSGFISNGAVNTTKVNNLVGFMAQAQNTQSVSNSSAGQQTDWNNLLDYVDLTQRWSTLSTTAYRTYTSSLFTSHVVSLSSTTCAYTGGNFCGRPHPMGTCGCDDGCSTRGNCCSDKTSTCGTQWLVQGLTQWGIDARTTGLVMFSAGDSDGDGIADATDNCPFVANANQADANNDGIGSACTDTDHDGRIDLNDNCPSTFNPAQIDTDSDGTGDACDSGEGEGGGGDGDDGDTDGDGVLDNSDNCPGVANANQADTNSDGVGNACEVGSNNANLSALNLSVGTLSPTFSSATRSYSATVGFLAATITITPTREASSATITVNGTAVTSGSASGDIALNTGANTITIVVTALDGATTATYTITVTRQAANLFAQQAYVKASNMEASDSFWSIAVSGNTMAVGAYLEDSNATGINGNQASNLASAAGAVYIFTRSGSTWTQQAYLKASNAETLDWFGKALALDGDTLVVGATGEDSNATGINGNQSDNSASSAGAAYVFVRSGSTWSQQAYLKASNTAASDLFGHKVAISGDTIVVSASSEDSNATGVNGNQSDNNAASSGAAYVFVRSGSTWSQQAYLKASNTAQSDFYGQSVGISGDTIVVGAYGEDSNATGVNGDESNNTASSAGAAYVYTRTNITWSQQAYLKASNAEASDNFGWNVAISNNTIVVIATGEDSNATGVNGNQSDNSVLSAGAAYVFFRNNTMWSQQAYLKASNPGASDNFGLGEGGLAISGNTIVIGATSEDSNATGVNGTQANENASGAGAAYLFTRSGPMWSQQAYVKASNTEASDSFGQYVGIGTDYIAVSASGEDSNATGINGDQSNNGASSAGAVYIFK